MSDKQPNPGSDAAVDLGCTCPVLDNGHGRGRRGGEFWIAGDCPLHGFGDVVVGPGVGSDA